MGGEDEKEMFGITCRHDACGGYIVKNSGCEQGNLNNDKIYHTNVDDSTARTSWVWGLNRTKTWLLSQFLEHWQQTEPKLALQLTVPLVQSWVPWSHDEFHDLLPWVGGSIRATQHSPVVWHWTNDQMRCRATNVHQSGPRDHNVASHVVGPALVLFTPG